MRNSKAILLSLFLIFLSACSERTIDRDELVERDGVFYEKFSTEPFTGSVTGRSSGRMSKGLFKGLVTTFDEEGRISAHVTYVNGLLDGEFSEFYPSGQLKIKGQYKDDILDGTLEMFSESGNLDATFTFVDAKFEGISNLYRDNGELRVSEEYRNDLKHGEYREYHEGGALKIRGQYREGFKFGKWDSFDEEGEQSSYELALINYYEARKTLPGEAAEFHENGFVKSAGLKKNGLRDGPWNFYDEQGEFLRTVEYEDGTEIASSK